MKQVFKRARKWVAHLNAKKSRPRKILSAQAERMRRACNLCGKAFRAPTAFLRFCKACKEQDEILRFADWLPSES